MALQSSGQISLADISAEKGFLPSNTSLNSLSTTNVNQYSISKPNGSQPHSISEFYGYDHNASLGIVLTPINLAGPYGDTNSACFEGGFGETNEYYYSGDGTFGPGSTLFYDAQGTSPVEPNSAWYRVDTASSYLVDDNSTVTFQALCFDGPPKKG